jgi:ankyrin repeat protein
MKVRFTPLITLGLIVSVFAVTANAVQAVSKQKETKVTSSQDFLNSVTQGDAAKVKQLLEQDSSLARTTDTDGVSAVLKAVYYNRKSVADILVAARNDLDIFEASATGQSTRVAELIKEDPSLVNAFAPDGFYPLGLAVFFAHPETVKILLAAGADVNAQARNAMKVRPIHAAAAAAQMDVTSSLIERGADVNARQQAGYTPLHEAAGSGKIEFARLFLDHGADVNAKTDDGKTALTLAKQAGKEKMVQLLRERGGKE